jgi:hypothetical protein
VDPGAAGTVVSVTDATPLSRAIERAAFHEGRCTSIVSSLLCGRVEG